MRLASLFIALSCVAMAQDLHGVSIGGTLYAPTIKNAAGNQPVMGYMALRHTDNGINVPLNVLDIDEVVTNNPLGPGDERSLLGLASGARMEFTKDRVTWIGEGNVTSYELIGVIFADGTFHGSSLKANPDDQNSPTIGELAWGHMSAHYAKVRSIARSLQYTEDKYTAMAQAQAPHMTPKSVVESMASRDGESSQSRYAMSHTLLDIREQLGEPEADKALARIAALPDMKKGE